MFPCPWRILFACERPKALPIRGALDVGLRHGNAGALKPINMCAEQKNKRENVYILWLSRAFFHLNTHRLYFFFTNENRRW